MMKNCDSCNKTIQDGEDKEFRNKILCEDCYIDEVMPKMSKAHNDDDAEFMRRLKNSYSVRRQKYD